MYRRYLIIGLVFLLLIGAYFVFFDKDKSDKEYEKYYKKLVEKGTYSDSLEDVSVNIYESSKNGKYIYSITLDNVSEKQSNVKVLIVDSNASKDKIDFFPSFGIIDNKGYALVPEGETSKDNEKEGLLLTTEYNSKIEYMLVYFCGNGEEQYIKIKVSDYLA